MKSNSKSEQAKIIKWFLFVPLLIIVLFVIIPFILMIFYSFTNWDGYSPSFDFVGIDNYTKLFSKDNIAPILVSIYYLASSGLQLLLGIFLAVYVYFQKRFKSITIIIILLPILLNTVAVGLMFRLFFTPGGTFDMFLNWTHIIPYLGDRESVKWIGDSSIVNYTLAFIAMWRYTPYTFLLIYGALLSIDKQIVKAAIIQGASNFQITINILLPNIKITLIIVITTLVIGALSSVELPMIMTNGELGTQTIVMRIQEIAFSMRDFGLASVVSIFVSSIILIIVGIKQVLGGESNENNN